ncbi:MAG: UbiA family prenyltransferase, partial [Candidatus Thermoplasmatota archaeon]|nr:UbiA family prenyltransferase [Candidatus Thermoplasmatota archaeon]
GAASITQLFSSITLIYISLYFLLITFACNINCLYDVKIDEKYKEHMSSAVKNLGKEKIKGIIILEAIAIIVLISVLFFRGFVITALLSLSGLGFGFIYSAEPVRVKRRGVLSPFPVLIGLYILPVLGGWFIFRDVLTLYIVVFCVGYALLNEGITLVNTCEDYKEDMEEGITTWAHIFNMKRTMRVAFIFTTLGGLLAVIGVMMKPILTGWTFYNIHSSILFIGMGIVNTIAILKIGGDIYDAGSKDDLQKSCKKAAKNMPQWFISSRYPLLMMAVLLLLAL